MNPAAGMPPDAVNSYACSTRLLPPGRERLELLGYRIEVTELADEQFYWHVWRGADHVNGGLSTVWAAACENAEHAALSHSYHDDYFFYRN